MWNMLTGKEARMIVVDGQFLLGVAAVLTSIATLWRTLRNTKSFSQQDSAKN